MENIGEWNMSDASIEMIFRNTIVDGNVQLIEATKRTNETDRDLCIMEQEEADVYSKSLECTNLNARLQNLATQVPNHQSIDEQESTRREKEELEQAVGQKVTRLKQLWVTLTDKLKITVAELTNLKSEVLDYELMRWKRNQQSAGNGAFFDRNLDSIEKWCQSLADLVWRNREQIKRVKRLTHQLALDYPGVQDILPTLGLEIDQLLDSLVKSAFIIVEQPPQVIKTKTRFTSTVRLLVGGGLNAHLTPSEVEVRIISSAQANKLLDCGNIARDEASGKILNNTGIMEYQPENQQLSVSLSSMQLKSIKRAERRGMESVADEKFSLLFQSKVCVGIDRLAIDVWTLSLPLVVIVHGTQEPHAWATVTWDNMSAEPGRVLFRVPDEVPWAQIAEALNSKFWSVTGRHLTNDNMKFLAEKASRSSSDLSSQDYSRLRLSWTQFGKEPLPGRSFTFWEWIYAIMKLTGEYLRGPWNEGHILGFVQKKRAEEILARCAPGTFLLRFSDSLLGAITIASVDNQRKIFMLQPSNTRDLAIRSLADRIYDLKDLLYLYPEISKQHAFSKYYTRVPDREPGYDQVIVGVMRIVGGRDSEIASQTSSQPARDSVGGGSQSAGPSSSYPTTSSSIIQLDQNTVSIGPSYLGQSEMEIQEDFAVNSGELPIIANFGFDQPDALHTPVNTNSYIFELL